jgi:hypothetical protein
MRCKDCSQVRGYPYKRSHLVTLRPTKISALDPPSTWWPGEPTAIAGLFQPDDDSPNKRSMDTIVPSSTYQGDRRQTFPGHVIDNVRDTEPATRGANWSRTKSSDPRAFGLDDPHLFTRWFPGVTWDHQC